MGKVYPQTEGTLKSFTRSCSRQAFSKICM